MEGGGGPIESGAVRELPNLPMLIILDPEIPTVERMTSKPGKPREAGRT